MFDSRVEVMGYNAAFLRDNVFDRSPLRAFSVDPATRIESNTFRNQDNPVTLQAVDAKVLDLSAEATGNRFEGSDQQLTVYAGDVTVAAGDEVTWQPLGAVIHHLSTEVVGTLNIAAGAVVKAQCTRFSPFEVSGVLRVDRATLTHRGDDTVGGDTGEGACGTSRWQIRQTSADAVVDITDTTIRNGYLNGPGVWRVSGSSFTESKANVTFSKSSFNENTFDDEPVPMVDGVELTSDDVITAVSEMPVISTSPESPHWNGTLEYTVSLPGTGLLNPDQVAAVKASFRADIRQWIYQNTDWYTPVSLTGSWSDVAPGVDLEFRGSVRLDASLTWWVVLHDDESAEFQIRATYQHPNYERVVGNSQVIQVTPIGTLPDNFGWEEISTKGTFLLGQCGSFSFGAFFIGGSVQGCMVHEYEIDAATSLGEAVFFSLESTRATGNWAIYTFETFSAGGDVESTELSASIAGTVVASNATFREFKNFNNCLNAGVGTAAFGFCWNTDGGENIGAVFIGVGVGGGFSLSSDAGSWAQEVYCHGKCAG